MYSISAWASLVQPGSPAPYSPRIIHTPSTATTPSLKDYHPDLTALGYTSLFVRLPTTPGPKSAGPYRVPLSPTNIPVPPIPSKPLNRFPSLAALRSARRPRSKSLTMPKPTPTAIAKRNKAKYPSHPHPPPLANELALMQFADGGHVDAHIKRLMDAQARAAAGSGPQVGVADVYRDGKGGIWWDQEEEWEYAHLLAADKPAPSPADRDWVRFAPHPCPDDDPERRGSVSTQASSLDARHVVRPMDEDAIAAFGSCVPPRALRTRRAQPQPRPEFLLAFTPRDAPLPKSKSRRRPAPLNLAPTAARRPSPLDARRDFIDGSFAPPPVPPIPAPAPAPPAAKRARGITLAGLFRRR